MSKASDPSLRSVGSSSLGFEKEEDLLQAFTQDFYSKIFATLLAKKRVIKDGLFVLQNGVQVSQELLDGPDCEVKWSNQVQYKGEVKRNKIEGTGVLMTPEAQLIFTGDYLNGVYEGDGILKHPSFTIKAKFHEGFPCGTAEILLRDGCYFKGVLNRKGRMVRGERKYSNGLYLGTFDEIQRRKQGVYVFEDQVLTGKFKDGLPHGLCHLSWKPSCPNSLKTEQLKEFRGNFKSGSRNGVGLMKWNSMLLVTVWRNNLKHGPGLLLARNGDFFVGNSMFESDRYRTSRKICPNSEDFKAVQGIFRAQHLKEDEFKKHIDYLCKSALEIGEEFPFYLPDFKIDLSATPIISFLCQNFPGTSPSPEQELRHLNQVIASEYFRIRDIYRCYANFSIQSEEQEVPRKEIKLVMNRLGLWQFMRDIGCDRKDFLVPLILDRAEAEFHIVVLNPNDFKEPVEFQAFLKYLLYLTLLVNEAADNLQAAIEAKPDFFGLFSTMFTIFLGNVVYTVKPFSSGLLADKLLKDDSILARFLTWCVRFKEPFSSRTIFQLLAVFKGEVDQPAVDQEDTPNFQDKAEEISGLKKFFRDISPQDVYEIYRGKFPQHFHDDGTITNSSFAIDGLELYEIFEQVLILGIKHAKYQAELESTKDLTES